MTSGFESYYFRVCSCHFFLDKLTYKCITSPRNLLQGKHYFTVLDLFWARQAISFPEFKTVWRLLVCMCLYRNIIQDTQSLFAEKKAYIYCHCILIIQLDDV